MNIENFTKILLMSCIIHHYIAASEGIKQDVVGIEKKSTLELPKEEKSKDSDQSADENELFKGCLKLTEKIRLQCDQLKTENKNLNTENQKLKSDNARYRDLYNQALNIHTQERVEWDTYKNFSQTEQARLETLWRSEKNSAEALRYESDDQKITICSLEKENTTLRDQINELNRRAFIHAVNKTIPDDFEPIQRYKNLATISGIGFLLLVLLYIRDRCASEKFLFA